MPLFGELQIACGLTATEVSVSQMFENKSRAIPLLNARRLAEAILAKRFAELTLESGEGLTVLSPKAAAEQAKSTFHDQPTESWFITETHAKTAKFNHWIRRQLFKDLAESSVTNGDLLEFYSSVDHVTDPFDASPRLLLSGERVVVESSEESSVPQSQLLAGRPTPIVFTTRRIEVNRAGSQQSLLALENFLLAEKPELDSELAVALNVWQKAHPAKPISRLRYGYAATGHHAQGMTQPVCFIDAGSEGGRHSESYFRWLYTAITRASRWCFVHNFRALDQFDEAQWNDRGAQAATSIPIGGGWHFAAKESGSGNQAPNESETLERKIREFTEPLGWHISGIQSHPYQEHFQLNGPVGAELKLMVSYNQGHEVTGMRVSDASVGQDLLVSVAEAAAMTSLEDSDGQQIIRSLRARATTKKLRVVGARRDGDYRLSAVFLGSDGARAQIEVNHNKDGIVSAVRLIKFVGSKIADDIRSALSMLGEKD